MKNNINHITVLLLLLGIAWSCHRRDLEYQNSDNCRIPIVIDWSDARLDPHTDQENLYCASVWIFRADGQQFSDGKSHKEYRLNDAERGEIELPAGEYSVLIFNNSTAEFNSNVAFSGTDSYHTFQYNLMPDQAVRVGDNPVQEPDILAVWSLDDYRVSPRMGQEEQRRLVGVKPQRLTYTMRVRAHVVNLNNAISCTATIEGMGHHVKLAHGEISATPSSYNFMLNNRQYDEGSATDGSIQAIFSTLGPLADQDSRYKLHLSFTLANEHQGSTTYPTPPASALTFDITEQIQKTWGTHRAAEDGGIQGEIVLDVEAAVELQLPPAPSGGFSVGVDEWGEGEWHDFPIE